MGRFDKTVSGSSANTGPSVIRLSKSGAGTSLELPPGIDLASADGLKLLNERLRQIQIELDRLASYETSLAAKGAYGALQTLSGTPKAITGAKTTLDKIGTWKIDFQALTTGAAEIFVVVDPLAEETAKKQAGGIKTSTAQAVSGSCLFTATTIPRLVQLYATGTGDIDDAQITALWVGRFEPGGKRFGRQTPNYYAGMIDATGETLTDHGEEARWPSSDHPDTMPEGIEQPGL